MTDLTLGSTFRGLMRLGYSSSFQNAATRYNERRRQVYQQVMHDIAGDLPSCRLGPILADALKAWDGTWRPLLPRGEEMGGWNWPQVAADYRKVDALTLAIWSGDSLCGLMAAQPSTRHTRLRLEYIEGSPIFLHPMKGHVLDVGILVAVRYAQTLGARTLRLINPAPGLVSRYQNRYRFGPVEFEGGGTYSEVRIQP